MSIDIEDVLKNCEGIAPIRIGNYLDHVKNSYYFMPKLNVQLVDYMNQSSHLYNKETTAFILHWVRINL